MPEVLSMAESTAGPMKVVHYINQFFAGHGSEEAADEPVSESRGPLGPGRLLQQHLTDSAVVVATIVAGDNYAAEKQDALTDAIRKALRAIRPDVVIAGPAFESGRYGMACMRVCSVAREEGIPAATAMHASNPALGMRAPGVVVVATTRNVRGMSEAIARLADLGLKLAKLQPLGSAAEEGYLPTGDRRLLTRAAPGRQRALDMLLAKLNGRAFQSELIGLSSERLAPAPPVRDLSHSKVALVTTSGVVPKGNPDRMPRGNSNKIYPYPLPIPGFVPGEWESVHGGYNVDSVNANPNYVVPLDVLQDFVHEGRIGSLDSDFFSLTGVWTQVAPARQIAKQLVERFKTDDVRAAILVAT
jgi:glycine reductase complex component B subunit gamma